MGLDMETSEKQTSSDVASLLPLDSTSHSHTTVSLSTEGVVDVPKQCHATDPIEPFLLDNFMLSKRPNTSDSGSLAGGRNGEESTDLREFEHSKSPTTIQRNCNVAYEVGGNGIKRMNKFTLWETKARFYLVGCDILGKNFRVLKIDRTEVPEHLNIFEDEKVYNIIEMNQLLNTINDGNKGAGGMKLKCHALGILGFIRFTESYYILLITKKSPVAILGGHYIYQIERTELVPLAVGPNSLFQRERNSEEEKFLKILGNLDLNRFFYFSYSYNITQTLQHNIIREREALQRGDRIQNHDLNDMFVWNHFLLEPARKAIKCTYDWCMPAIHGFIAQSTSNIHRRHVCITLLARRSRFFAGARFLKRGANDLGYVANDVETEQIVSDISTTSFHASGPRLYSNPMYTSFVQHRGSIPLYWTQDNSGVTPKPNINICLVDPFYSAAALHFDNLFERYGAPIYVLCLIKQRERRPRESILLHEYKKAIDFLNQSLPPDKKILYKHFDMSRASKTRGHDVIRSLEDIAEETLQKTGFFRSGDARTDSSQVQNGIARTNCIDCLDRTNAAQFVIGKRALGRQLQALGVITGQTIQYGTIEENIFTQMFHDHGDTIAIQYGGSHLVNTMATYQKINQWQNQSRDMVESVKRYYRNSFHDSQRQEAYNLFLGNYIFAQGQPRLWDLATDYGLHHTHPRSRSRQGRRDYFHWFTDAFLQIRSLPPSGSVCSIQDIAERDNYWLEYYRPLVLSDLKQLFFWKDRRESPTNAYEKYSSGDWYDLSLFSHPKSLTSGLVDFSERRSSNKVATVVDPRMDDGLVQYCNEEEVSEQLEQDGNVLPSRSESHKDDTVLRKTSKLADRFVSQHEKQPHNSMQRPISDIVLHGISPDKGLMAHWTLDQFLFSSLNPSVSKTEAEEYEHYVSHPLNLPLAVSNDLPDGSANLDFVEYVNSVNDDMKNGTSFVNKELEVSEEDLADYTEFLTFSENPLTVVDEDGKKNRYKRYGQWLRGKSLFKQSKVDPEYNKTT